MVLGYHLVATAFGWWLPNDLRGSMSRTIYCDVIRELGDLHYGRKKVQPASRDIRAFYERARDVLKHELLEFSGGSFGHCGGVWGDCVAAPVYVLRVRDHARSLSCLHPQAQASGGGDDR